MIYGRYNSYFTLIKKKKLHFSFICSFFCRLVKKSWALKVVEQFSIRGLVAYEPVAYKKSKCSFQMSYFHMRFSLKRVVWGTWRQWIFTAVFTVSKMTRIKVLSLLNWISMFIHYCKCITRTDSLRWQDIEAVAQRCSVIKVFLEISQNSQENGCVRVSF